jgi:hypothetical protein
MEYNQLITSQLNFIGKVLCVFSHEINNQLAVMKESIGLVGDLIEAGKTSRKDLKEILAIIHSIESQIGRTTYFCNNLNGFGHGMEDVSSSFNVSKSIEELIVLLSRLASQKRVSIEKKLKPDVPLIQGNPLRLQFLIFYFIERYLLGLERDGSILIETSFSKSSVSISILPIGATREPSGKEIFGDEVFKSIAGDWEVKTSGKGPEGGVTITLPAAPELSADTNK